jgi:SAM-dependent methyltransferase
MLKVARQRVLSVRLVGGDLRALPLGDRSADVLTCGLALTHVPNLAPVLAEFARVLRPGATAIVSDVHPELVYRGSVVKAETPAGEPQTAAFHLRTVADHVRAALAAGFTVRRLEELRSGAAADPDPADNTLTSDLGPWRLWPWSLLDRAPAAARVAWDIPALLVLQLDRA